MWMVVGLPIRENCIYFFTGQLVPLSFIASMVTTIIRFCLICHNHLSNQDEEKKSAFALGQINLPNLHTSIVSISSNEGSFRWYFVGSASSSIPVADALLDPAEEENKSLRE